MGDCHNCRFELQGERSPHNRCLIGYGEAQTFCKVRDEGLLGKCKDWKGIEPDDFEKQGEVK